MDAEKVAKLIEAIALVFQALAWPIIVIFLLIYFGAPLKKFLNDVGELTLDIPVFKTSVKIQKQIEAAALLGAASAKSSSEGKGTTGTEVQNAREIAGIVGQTLKPKIIRKLSEATVLWVDDIPSNNHYERSALETLGLSFTVSTSTEDALEKIRVRKYDVIISDMGRPGDTQAGYTLLEEVRKLGDSTPFIIYSSSNNPRHKELARNKGAFGSVNNPQELFQLVLSALSSDQ